MNTVLKEKEEFFKSISLFEGLSTRDLDEILLFTEPFSVEANTMLFRQGDKATGMYFLNKGQVRLYIDVPGNDVLELGIVSSGDVVGETALIEYGYCLTYAVTLEATSGYFLSNLRFEMLRFSLKSEALNLMNCFRRKICGSIRSSIAQISGMVSALDVEAIPTSAVQENHLIPEEATSPLILDRAMLRSIPLLQIFTSSELEEFIAPMLLYNLPQGHVLYIEGNLSDSCFIIIRGAVRASIYRYGRYEHLAIYGPSRIVGIPEMIDSLTHPTTCVVREQTMLLEINRSYFENMSRGSKDINFKFLRLLNRELASDLRKLIRQITRLASQIS